MVASMFTPAPLSRRAFLRSSTLAAGAVLGATALHAASSWARDLVDAERADVDRLIPAAGCRTTWSTMWSSARQQQVEIGVALPPGAVSLEGQPVCVVLHGRGGSPRVALEDLGLGQFIAAEVARGARPFALVAVPGGTTYWHRRNDGDDPAGMIWDEVLPRLAAQGADVDRVGLWGWSMGGFGALLLAEQRLERVRGRRRSTCLWPTLQAATEGAFDDAADWARNDVMTRLGRLQGLPLRIDCGSSDRYTHAHVNRLLLPG